MKSPLAEAIAGQIARSPQQRITFAEYMELALYHPEYGYYSSGTAAIGAEGDYFTSVSLGSDLGALLAEQFAQMWQLLGQPSPFSLLEMGAGQGLLAADILNHLSDRFPELVRAVRYIIIEKAPAAIAQQQAELHVQIERGIDITWRAWSEIADNSLVGCCFANELVDAFPVHRVSIEAGRLQEIYVMQGEGERPFVEVSDEPSTPNLAAYFAEVGVEFPSPDHPDGYRTEVNLAARDWLATVARKLQRGYSIAIDYGYPAWKYYHPQRDRGTLQCYYRHHRNADPYTDVGHRDITAHVDFTALEVWGKAVGLERLGFTQQAPFLMALGLGDRLQALSSGTYPLAEILQRRDALHQLLDPTGLGGFGVLVQAKGLFPKERSLRGLAVPEFSF